MAAGSIVVDLLMKTGSFETDTKRAEKRLKEFEETAKAWGKAIAVSAAAAGVAVAYMTKQAIDNMDKLGKQAQMAGVTVESLSALSYAAELAGLSQDELTSSMVKLTKGMSDAKQGTGEALKGFQALGIEVDKLGSADSAMQAIAEQFAGMKDGAEKTALAVSLFGRSGAQMIPFLNAGADGLRQMSKEADILGKVISTETAKSAEEFNDTLTKMGSISEGLINRFAAGVLPALNNLTQAFFDAYLQADGMREEINKLVGVDMVRWAENIGIALAHIVDVGVMVARVMVAIGSSIRVVANDILVLWNAMKFLTPEGVTNTMGVYEQLQRSIDDRRAALEFAADAYDKVFNSNGAFFTQMTQQAVEMARLTRLLPNDEDFGVSPSFKRDAPKLTTADKGGQKELEKMRNMLTEAQKLGAEYDRERQHSLEMLKIRDQLAGMTENERKVQLAVNEVLNATNKALEQIVNKREAAAGRGASEAVLAEYDAQIEKVKQLGKEYVSLARTQEQSSIDAQNTFSTGWNRALAQYAENSRNYSKKAADMFESVTSNMSSAIANFVETGRFSFADFTNSVLKDLLRIELQMRAMILFRAAASAVTSALFPTTTASTIGSGTTAGGAGALAFPVSLSSGGYTGDGGKYEPAGIVHRGEYVLNAEATKKIGVAKLDVLNGYANGGYVGSQPPPQMGGPSVVINMVNQSKQPLQAEQSQPRFDGQKFVQDIILSDLRRNGPIAQSIRG
jgi:lambda family phage tail tape measure protein